MISDKHQGRPLITFDIEATGRDSGNDRIVLLGGTKFLPALPLLGTPAESISREWRINPGRFMDDEVIAVHGITNEVVADWKPFRHYATEIYDFFQDCDLIGFNLFNYDVPMLWEEFYRCGIAWVTDNLRIVDAGNIFKKKEERSLSAAVRFYLDREHVGAHGAQEDANATAEVLDAQLERYPDLLAMSLDDLAAFSRMDERIDLAGKIVKGPDGRPTYTLRRVRGVAVEDDPGFAYWMLDKDFPENTKMVLRNILELGEPTPDGDDDLDDYEIPFL